MDWGPGPGASAPGCPPDFYRKETATVTLGFLHRFPTGAVAGTQQVLIGVLNDRRGERHGADRMDRGGPVLGAFSVPGKPAAEDHGLARS